VKDLAELARVAEARLASLGELTGQAERAAQRASEARQEADLLAAVAMPAEVPGLARRIAEADRLIAERKAQRDVAERAEAAAALARDQLPDKTRLEMLRQAYTERQVQEEQLGQQEQQLAAKEAARDRHLEAVEGAERELAQAREDRANAERSFSAAALAQVLRAGEDCPVCRQPVTALPHHPAPAGLARTGEAVEAAQERLRRERVLLEKSASAAAETRSRAAVTRERLEKLSSALAGAPSQADVLASLEAVVQADAALGQAQHQARASRAAVMEAERLRASLTDEERDARARLATARDSVVQFGAPAAEDADLAAAWETLTTWAGAQHAGRAQRQPDLDSAASEFRRRVAREEQALAGLLSAHDIPGVTDPARAAAAVAGHLARAESDLAVVRDNRKKAALLDQQIRAHQEEQQVATMLGNLLKANSFERWLCGEALDSLMAEASETLMELSGGQYQLDRDDRNELTVIDYQDAGARRPVHTLSGGETFQASLALALALSQQVIGLSAGMRDLNSMFLDEGFGTLDRDTLETVAATLERLAANSDRMVGVITHVPALAERVPVRFVVSNTGGTSMLRKERV
jgi:exonuclease SbcC